MISEFDFGLIVMQFEVTKVDPLAEACWKDKLRCLLLSDTGRVLVAVDDEGGWGEEEWVTALTSAVNVMRVRELQLPHEVKPFSKSDKIVVDGRFSPPLPSGRREYVRVRRDFVLSLLGELSSLLMREYVE